MASPVRHPQHGRPHFRLIGWLCQYVAATPGTDGGDNSTVRLDLGSLPQPDAFLRILPEHGGQSGDSDDGYVVGAPELVAEVAASSASYDLHDKLAAYRQHGVQEYIVWRVEEQAIDWFVLRDGHFEAQSPSDGVLRSALFPGLLLDADALLRGNIREVLATLAAAVATPEHAAFVARLSEGQE